MINTLLLENNGILGIIIFNPIRLMHLRLLKVILIMSTISYTVLYVSQTDTFTLVSEFASPKCNTTEKQMFKFVSH